MKFKHKLMQNNITESDLESVIKFLKNNKDYLTLRRVKTNKKFCYPIVKPPEFLQKSENSFTLSTEKG